MIDKVGLENQLKAQKFIRQTNHNDWFKYMKILQKKIRKIIIRLKYFLNNPSFEAYILMCDILF